MSRKTSLKIIFDLIHNAMNTVMDKWRLLNIIHQPMQIHICISIVT
ncbi:hypothetical protein HMPREF0262_00641 [Clostridium sp. ATCC 29733]|nr:hypothetical protein HMPREF0262_00641 [Clostridium sp. ATCC 29733]